MSPPLFKESLLCLTYRGGGVCVRVCAHVVFTAVPMPPMTLITVLGVKEMMDIDKHKDCHLVYRTVTISIMLNRCRFVFLFCLTESSHG